jgi:hypothetical protein
MTAPAKAAPMREDVTPGLKHLDHLWTGDGNRCGVTGYDGPICSKCGVADINASAICSARLAELGATPELVEEAACRIRDLELALVTARVNLMRAPQNASAVETFIAGILSGHSIADAAKSTDRLAHTARPDAGDEDVERVAIGFLAAWYDWHGDPLPWWNALTPDRQLAARNAALAAMREGVDRGMVERASVVRMLRADSKTIRQNANQYAEESPADARALHEVATTLLFKARQIERGDHNPGAPMTAQNLMDLIRGWLDADNATHWGAFEKALDAALSPEQPR